MAVELRDFETQGHTERVTHLALTFGAALGLPPERLLGLPTLEQTYAQVVKSLPRIGRSLGGGSKRLSRGLGVPETALQEAELQEHVGFVLGVPARSGAALRTLQGGADAPYALVDDAALDVGGLHAVFVEPAAGAAPVHAVP